MLKVDRRKLFRVDHTGESFGFLTVIFRGQRKNHWLCACKCGAHKEIFIGNLQSGDVKSCGCSTNLLLNRTKSHRDNLIRRFENLYIPEPNSGCWIWLGAVIDSTGYGTFNWNKKIVSAHRASFVLAKGEIPEGAMVLHKCDVRCCVNPEHLYLGDHTQNMQDMLDRDRSARGEKNAHAKLTSLQVEEIRRTYVKRRGNLMALAKKFGVSRYAIHYVLKRETWQ